VRGVAAWAFVLLVAFAAFANAAAYIAQDGNPLVSSDAWYFVDAFLQKAMEHGASLQDFFAKRDALDHAQPLGKLVLLANARWLGLDFVFEALIGLCFAALMFVVLLRSTRDTRQDQPWWLWALGAGTLSAVLVTLNSGMVYNWSLVTLVFMAYFMAVAGAAVAWRALVVGRYMGLFAAALAIAFCFDDVGLIILAALVIATCAAAAKLGRMRAGLVASTAIIAGEACYLFASHALLSPRVPGLAGAGGAMANLDALWALRGEWPTIVRIVFGSTLAHINPIAHFFPDAAPQWQGGLAVVAVLAHAWFWWRAWTGRWNLPVFHAVVLMLVFYASIAGILYGRLPIYGVGYLNEPRYVSTYLLGNVALVLMVLGQPWEARRLRARALAGAALGALLALQVPLSLFSWYEGSFLFAYYHKMASEMIELGHDSVPATCVPMLTVCGMPAAERARAVGFLRRHELNVYSEDFIARYRLEKLEAPVTAPGAEEEQ
jgi:hypothetical protein